MPCNPSNAAAGIALPLAELLAARKDAASLQEALELCRRIGHRAGTAGALEGLADVATMSDAADAADEAAALIEEAAALRAKIGVPRLAAD